MVDSVRPAAEDGDMSRAVILFDDGGGRLSPVCDLRASFELRTGAMTTGERLAAQLGEPIAAAFVPEALGPLVATRWAVPINRLPEDADELLMLNGRWPRVSADLPSEINSALVTSDGQVIAALVDREQAMAFMASGCRDLPDAVDIEPIEDAGLIERPWHVLQVMDAGNLRDDLQWLAEHRDDLRRLDPADHHMVAIVGDHPVYVGPNIELHPFTAFNTLKGPIVIEPDVQINAHSVVYGPCYIGEHSVLHHRSDVGYSAIGPHCKLGGEVNVCVFQGYANKSHSGFVGHTYIGEWSNLGASTVSSNLKNTYGEVSMVCEPGAAAEPTGMQFLGSIIGDHVRTAIGTRLSTGSCLHTGAMLAISRSSPRCVERFAFLTDDGAGRYVFEKFALIVDRMMIRRGRRVTAELAQRFAQLYAETTRG